jgi:hypothetical protein
MTHLSTVRQFTNSLIGKGDLARDCGLALHWTTSTGRLPPFRQVLVQHPRQSLRGERRAHGAHHTQRAALVERHQFIQLRFDLLSSGVFTT